MANIRGLALISCLTILLSLGAGAAWADGYRFGGWRFGGPYFGGSRFGSPSFAGPRYDGPRLYDLDAAPDERITPPPGPPPGPAPGAPIGAAHPGPPPGSPPSPPLGPPPHGTHKCYTASETRERVASANLRDPFALMRKASAMTQAEALAGKLCRWNDQDIYEISLLRRDGLLIHVFMNATTGQVVEDVKPH